MFKRKHNPSDSFVSSQDEFDRALTKSTESDRRALVAFTVAGVLLLVLAYLFTHSTTAGPRVQVKNPSSHSVYVGIYCGRFDPNAPASDDLDGAEPKPQVVLRQRRSMHVAGHSSVSMAIGPEYAPCVDEALLADPTQDTRHPDRECYAVYTVDQPMPRKFTRTEVEIWTEPMHREGSLEEKYLAVRIADGCAPVQLAF